MVADGWEDAPDPVVVAVPIRAECAKGAEAAA
jgi:hypothetical protein